MNREDLAKTWSFKYLYESSNRDKLVFVGQFTLTPFYPLVSWMEHKFKGKWRESSIVFWIIRIALFFLVCLTSGFFTNIMGLKSAFSILELVRSIVTLLGAFVLYILFSSLLNLLMVIFINTIDQHLIMKDAFSYAMKDDVDIWLGKILGHKMWTGNNTYNLFEKLMSDTLNVNRAKWLMVNFLKEEVEDTFSDSSLYTLRSKKPWQVHKYSNFLSENIEHANHIIWYLDASIFFETILPTFYLYIVAIIGQLEWKYRINMQFPGSCEEINLENCFDKSKVNKKNKRLFKSLLVPKPDEPIKNWKDDPEKKMNTIEKNIFPSQIKLGFQALTKKDFSWRNKSFSHILDGYHEVIEKYMTLPHNEAFRKSTAVKLRYICLTYPINEGEEISPENVRLAITEEYEKSKDGIKSTVTSNCNNLKMTENVLSAILDLDGSDDGKGDKIAGRFMRYHPKILAYSLKLFSYTCGGEQHCKILELRGNNINEIKDKDIGIYDKKIVVESVKSEASSLSPRAVTWQYYPPSDDHDLIKNSNDFPECDYSIFMDQCKNIANRSVMTDNKE